MLPRCYPVVAFPRGAGHHGLQEPENLEPEWIFRQKKIRDVNGFRDPSFPLHLVKENMCHLGVFGRNLVRLSSTNPLCCPGVVVEPTTETNMEPNEFNFWGLQLQHVHHQIVTFVFLLLLVALLCCPFMSLAFSLFAVRFSACCSLLWKVVRRTRNPTHIEK